MKTTTIVRNIVLGLGLLIGLQSIAAAEYRCGWLDNSAQGSYQFIDKQATWTIAKLGSYQIPQASMNNLPQKLESEFVSTAGGFGYSCSCLSVRTDAATKRITAILYKGKQVLLKRCLEDKTILSNKPTVLRFSGAATNQSTSRSNRRSFAGNFPKPTGSYTDKLVVGKGFVTVSNKAYQDTRVLKEKAKSHYIQVIVTSMPAKAKRLKKNFDNAGFKTIISDIRSKGRVLHKVRIGPFPSRRAAVNSQIKLRQSFSKDRGVQKSIIVG